MAPGGKQRLRFETHARRAARLVVDPAFAAAAQALELLDPGALSRHLASASGARGRAHTAVLPLGGDLWLHLRPVRHGGLLGPFWGERLLGLGRAVRELEATATLRARGAPVPRPVLAVGARRGALWSAALGTLHESGTSDGARLLDARPAAGALRLAIEAAAVALRRFHDAGGRHADLHVGNLLFREQDGGFEVLVIDLDKARAGAPADPRRRMRELMRLVRSLHKRGAADVIGARGCAHFLRAYCAGDRALRRALLRSLPHERRRLARHARSWLRRPAVPADPRA